MIAKYTDRLHGTASEVVTRRAADPMGLTTYGRTFPDGPSRFVLRALSMAGGFDVVHVHSLDRVVPWLKVLRRGKPVILHYHGTDILGRWNEKKGRWERADFVAYSTPNLAEGAPVRAVQVPNPVDTELFHPREGERRTGSALAIRYGMDDAVKAKARELSLDLTIVDRGSVPYSQMPALLSMFEYFIDFRRPPGFDRPVMSMGKAALESLASGCKAIGWEGEVQEGLPEEHRPESVAARWFEAYGRLAGRER